MYKLHNGFTTGFNGSLVNYMWVKHSNPSDSIAIILPGKGYSIQAPILYYSIGLFVNKGFDILTVNYDYNNENFSKQSEDNQLEQIKMDVASVINVIQDYIEQYTNCYLVGKSIGTAAMSLELRKREFLTKCKAVWLTPLLTKDFVYQTMKESRNESLVIIGDKDPFYNDERFSFLSEQTNIKAVRIEGADHSLEIKGQTFSSMEILKDVITEIEKF